MAEIFGTSGRDGIIGTDGDDIIHGLENDDQILGGLGNDIIYGDEGIDTLGGGDGNDTLYNGIGIGSLSGGAGADTLDASTADFATLYSHVAAGVTNTDVFTERDVLIGGSGGDTFFAGFNDSISGGGGFDSLDLNLQGAPTGLTVNLTPLATGGNLQNGSGTVQLTAVYFHVTGTQFDDVVTGISVSPPFPSIGASADGAAGNDMLTGGTGGERLWGGIGSDTLRGGGGNDYLFSGERDPNVQYGHTDTGTETDGLFGEDGDDVLFAALGDNIDGGSGYDIILIDLSNAGAAVTFLSSGAVTSAGITVAGGGHISNVEGLVSLILPNFINTVDISSFYLPAVGVHEPALSGGNMRDVLTGSGTTDYLTGNGGVDWLRGGGGDDRLDGSDGDDVLEGGIGNDAIYGGAGIDIVSYASATSRIIVNITWGTRTTLGAGTDYLWDVEGVEGSAFDDILTGNALDNIITGLSGNDALFGGNGNDTITGGSGRDEVFGEGGDDTLSDSGGSIGQEDALFGGTGNDIYVVEQRGTSTIEVAGQGFDEVRTAIPVYALQSNIESLTFTDSGIHGAGVGNALDNTLRGGSGRDDLFGRDGNDVLIGGTGTANSLFGQAGDDTYVVQASGDSVKENAGEGRDTVQTDLSVFTLPDNVEVLIYVGSTEFLGIGNGAANEIAGGAGADFLSGLGGDDILYGNSGSDIAFGGTGADQFRYGGGETGLDRVIDFTSGTDKIALNAGNFAVTGTLEFVSGSAATSDNSTIIYDRTTGIVSYDADGTGAEAAIQIAQINIGQTFVLGDVMFF